MTDYKFNIGEWVKVPGFSKPWIVKERGAMYILVDPECEYRGCEAYEDDLEKVED